MSKWLRRALDVVIVALIVAAIPFAMRAYHPIEQNNKAVAALEAKRYDEAIALLSEAIQAKPDNEVIRRNLVAAYNSKAVALEKEGREREAVASYEKALSLDPKNQTILRNLVATLNNLAVERSSARDFVHSQQLFEEASKWLKQIEDETVQRNVLKNYAGLLTVWGAELMKRNQPDGAIQAFEQALRLAPDNAAANIYLGDLAYEANDFERAGRYYREALKLDRENAEYLKSRIKMLENEARIEPKLKTYPDPQNEFRIQAIPYTSGIPVPTIREMLREARRVIGQKLGIYPGRAVNVKIYEPEDFFKISMLPEWAVGIYDGKMRLKLDDIHGAPTQVRDLLFHEYTHAVLAMNIKQKVPAWFHEGLAQLMEPQFAESMREQVQMREALMKKKLTFETLQASFKDIDSKRDAEDAYLMSKYFLSYLNRRYGAEKLREWIQHLANEEAFPDAFQKVYGEPLKDVQNEWIQAQLR
jgi:tetratricopeptide (TPR) repeat protein